MEDGGPSVTARRVAAHRLGFSRVPAAYGVPAADEALAADVAAGLVAPANRMHDYLAARTSFFDRTVVSAIDRGVRQVVVGAAGYDGRAFRYAKPGVRWFEVDHPATQRDKLERLERLGIAASHVRFVEADFTRDPVADRLRAAGLEATRAQPVPARRGRRLPGVGRPGDRARAVPPGRRARQPPGHQRVAVAGARRGRPGPLPGRGGRPGEPARSTFDAGQAEDLLARTGWRTIPGREETAAKRERLRSAGLLTASVGPWAPQASAPSKPSKPPRPSASPPPSAPPPGSVSLSALLSQALVAYTIEFDNEAEHRLPHRTTDHGASGQAGGDPTTWLVSLVMWENCLRHVTDQPITVGELETRARTGTNLDGMRRWGYITIDGTATKIHKGRPGPAAVLRATAAGLRAREVYLPLPGLIEQRWRERFGVGQVDRLRESLVTVVSQLDPGLPDCLPILGAALLSRGPDPALPPAGHVDQAGLPLSALLSRVLLSFVLEYEREAGLSLAISANVLRVLGADGTRLRDLPPLTGTSKEAVSWALGILIREYRAAEEPDPAASRGKIARLTPGGLARAASLPRVPRHDRAALARALHRPRDRRHPDIAGRAGRRARRCAAAAVRRSRALPGQLASRGPPPGHPAALPDGPAPRRLPRR